MNDWLTSREVAEILNVHWKNIKQVSGYGRIQRRKGAPYGGYLYKASDVLAVAEYRASGQAKEDSYANRQSKKSKTRKTTAAPVKAAKRARRKSVPPARNGRSVDPLTYRLNRAAIAAQEAAVRSGKLKPKYLPPGQTDY